MAEGFAEYPPRTALPNLTLQESTIREKVNAAEVTENWLARLVDSVTKKDAAGLSALVFKESWWRDVVGLSWGITSKNGPDAITEYVIASTAEFSQASIITSPPLCPQLVDMGPMTFIQSGFTFTTKHGSGRGIIRLGNDGQDSWKAWTISTQLEELHSRDSQKESSMANGSATNGVNGNAGESDNLQVLVVGSGQSGAMLGAWLKELGINYLIVDRQARPGDTWRARYDSIKSHTPMYCDHFPFIKYPTNWPTFLNRDPMANWIEHYCDIMELNIIQNAAVTTIDRNAETGKYSIKVNVNGESRIYKANHVVLATGVCDVAPDLPEIKSQESFKGLAYHTADHKSPSQVQDVQNKRVVIVGAASSGHDVAQDFVNAGAKSVSMIQRNRMAVVSPAAIEKFQVPLWNTPGLSTEDADLLGISMPIAIGLTLGVGMGHMMREHDKELLDGLQKAGMALADGADGIGLLDFQLVKFGHFYIDQGACPMILDGRIKIHRCEGGVEEFYENGVVLADGTRVDADVVVFATGFKPMHNSLEPILGREIATKASTWLKMNHETELGAWRPTGMAGLWYMAGSFMLSRQYSKILALQISAVERGFDDQHFKDV